MQIHELSATALLQSLRAREVSSVEAVRALIARRHAVDGQIGAFTARLDEQALAEAQSLDERRARGEEAGPLHGLPMTIKDNIDVRGTDVTMGLRSGIGKPAIEDALVVRELRRMGAIVLGKTNVPQLLLVQETDNDVFGVTRNPFNLERSPGGSSGGEAAAVAAGMTPLGIGSDIGGSIRIPAHFCGIAGFKPTLDRWSMRGMHGGFDGQEMVRAQMGALARTARDLQLVFGAVDPRRLAQQDPAVPPLPPPDPDAVSLAGLRIGCFVDDGFMAPCPTIQRAVRRAAEVLRAAGAQIIEYQPPAPHDLLYLWLAGLTSDGGTTLRRRMTQDEPCRQLRPTMQVALIPQPVRQLLAAVLERTGEGRLGRLLRCIGQKPVDELWRLTSQRTALRRGELDAWNTAQLDAVLCPPHVLPAMPLGTSGDLTLTLSYMFRYVMLNFPAGIVPVTRVQEDETAWAGPPPLDRVARRCSEVMRGSAGLPVGVQVVARPFREDVALRVMLAVEEAVRGDAAFPRTPTDPIAASVSISAR